MDTKLLQTDQQLCETRFANFVLICRDISLNELRASELNLEQLS